MKRVRKKPAERKREIMSASGKLFHTQGYENTSVNNIIDEIGVAKGTFYHYFESKEDLLEEIVHDFLAQILQRAEMIVNDENIKAIQKLEMIYFGEKGDADKVEELSKELVQPKNRVLNEKINTLLVAELSPLIAEIFRQGKKEGVFNVENTLAVAQFLVTGSQFVFDDGLFQWSKEEVKDLRKAMQISFEKTLGAKKGSLKFISKKI